MIDAKLLQNFTQNIEWLRTTQKPTTSASPASKQSSFASGGLTFKELMAQFEISEGENLLPLTSISAPSIPASEVKGWSPFAKWEPCSASAALGQPQYLRWSPLSGSWKPC